MDKKTARERGLAARRNMKPEVRNEKNRLIADLLIEKIRDASCVGCYVPLADEADTEPVIRWCLGHHIRVAVPKVCGNTLQFLEIFSMDDLEEGHFHVREPKTDIIVEPEETDVMIVPLSAFDEQGHRTGYGRGFYDTVLRRCRHTVGAAYSEQKTDEIETDPWDVDLDEVVYA